MRIAMTMLALAVGCRGAADKANEQLMKEVVAALCKCTDPVCLTEEQQRAAPKLKRVADENPDLIEKYGDAMMKCSKKASGLP